jgi:hypothetical protein
MGNEPLVSPSPPEPNRLETAIREAVAYSDVFDYPVTAQEIHRYLVGCAATPETVQQALDTSLLPGGRLKSKSGYIFLPGREALVPLRQHRAGIAQSLWQHAYTYGIRIAQVPFVRMVAITGALALDNVNEDADIDYLIVTEPGRLWLCRALVIGVVRWAKRRGHVLCPNYILSERALVINERNLYTAREVAQMAPIAGFALYQRLRSLNPWVDELLPNAKGPPGRIEPAPIIHSPLRSWSERLLRTPFGDRLEAWEMHRKIDKLQKQKAHTTAPDESAFCADWCKGHFDGHAHLVLRSYSQRLDQLPTAPVRQKSASPSAVAGVVE